VKIKFITELIYYKIQLNPHNPEKYIIR